MYDFIWRICLFIYDFFYNLDMAITTYISNYGTKANRIKLTWDNFNIFLDKTILNGDLLSIGMTWRELINYFLPIFFVVLFIVLLIKIIFKLLGVFKIND